MIILVICDYCGHTKASKDNKVLQPRCKQCNSRVRVKKYEPIDGYKGCPPFAAYVPSIVLPEAISPPWKDYGSYGDIVHELQDLYGEYYD
jgi:hypothetical protein